MTPTLLHGTMACFATPEAFLDGLRRAREAGYSRLDVYVPYSVEGMEEWLPHKHSPMPLIVLIAGITGAIGGYYLQWYAVHDYIINVGGRPITSWPAFVPVTFELTVLTAAITGVLALFWLAGLPRLDHPVIADPRFDRASQDRFFLCIRRTDTKFERDATRRFLNTLPAESVAEVPA